MIVERVHTFGDDRGLVGVVTSPASPRAGAPAVVLLNAGLVHRVGPFRMHVELARRLAGAGFLVLRMDQSSLGDSQARPAGLSYEERAVLDARQAFDFLTERYGTPRFVVVGLCAGAMNAHRVALADDRVVGCCLLDGYAYRTKGFWIRRAASAALDPRAWRGLAARLARGVKQGSLLHVLDRSEGDWSAPSGESPGEDATSIFAQDWPPLSEVRGELERIVARGVRMLYVYTGGWSDFTHPSQFDEMFPDLPARSVDVRYFPEADHTYVILAHREKMLREVEAFLLRVASSDERRGA
ncbi:MAG: alpha/beta hydrolase [Myxococcales bacterium]|nr:alpha/beta hydrolase [Myxococcales bacterium]